MLPYWSCAVTETVIAVPAVAVAGAEITNFEAAAALTVIAPEVPVIDGVMVSVAVTVLLPAVFKVTEKTLTPLVRAEFAGSTAFVSLLVMATIPL